VAVIETGELTDGEGTVAEADDHTIGNEWTHWGGPLGEGDFDEGS